MKTGSVSLEGHTEGAFEIYTLKLHKAESNDVMMRPIEQIMFEEYMNSESIADRLLLLSMIVRKLEGGEE